jgi:RimJ/RimL family protein N-acetyltransferase
VTVTRTAQLADLPAVNALHARCSLATTYARYRCARRSLERREWARLVHPAAGLTWVTGPAEQPELVIAVTHLLKTGKPGVSELAVLVEDSWQGRGIGTRLATEALAAAGADPSCQRVEVLTGSDNERQLGRLRTLMHSTAPIELTLMED